LRDSEAHCASGFSGIFRKSGLKLQEPAIFLKVDQADAHLTVEAVYSPANCVAVSTGNLYARLVNRFLMILLLSIGAGCSFGQDQTPSKPKQFICVLRLVPRLYDEHAWSKEDDAAFDQHSNRLKEATDRGQVICVGRTAESLDKTFGIVVLEAKDQEAAAEFMNNDPTVVAGLVTMELHPFALALERKNP
jgi:uncharacterized protein YciI